MKVAMLAGMLVMGGALLLTSGCTTMFPGGPAPTGAIVTDVKCPAANLAVAVDPAAKSTKVGEATMSSLLGILAKGDNSVNAAMVDGKITKVHHVDQHVLSYVFGIYIESTTVVHGE